MLISELIKELEKQQKENGDHPVSIYVGDGEFDALTAVEYITVGDSGDGEDDMNFILLTEAIRKQLNKETTGPW